MRRQRSDGLVTAKNGKGVRGIGNAGTSDGGEEWGEGIARLCEGKAVTSRAKAELFAEW